MKKIIITVLIGLSPYLITFSIDMIISEIIVGRHSYDDWVNLGIIDMTYGELMGIIVFVTLLVVLFTLIAVGEYISKHKDD
jgi:hypothetical protein